MKLFSLAALLTVSLAAQPARAGITSLTLDAPACYQVSGNKCLITASAIAASSNDGTLANVLMSIDDHTVLNVVAFFQNSVYYSGDRFGPGFAVKCGAVGSGGDPVLGAKHTVTLQVFQVNNPSWVLKNEIGVLCPAK